METGLLRALWPHDPAELAKSRFTESLSLPNKVESIEGDDPRVTSELYIHVCIPVCMFVHVNLLTCDIYMHLCSHTIVCLCVYANVLTYIVSVGGGQRWLSHVFLYHSLPCILRQGFFIELKAH